ncbi:hemerythrin domain-containing protein [Indiicoccus explosivorum]|uniref:hemerythrin domain-containing protein n=1 Tax=Indiicoccus explosivorum TaxID=1917864 RepID=UPI001F4D5438|nr:hemerythrin domain-containing protein [Indiicoccus explosivorum]
MDELSGPALRKVDSHTAIHEAALQEAAELTNVLHNLLLEGDKERALETAYILVEHWETRTLAHADAEEAGLYQEIAGDSPELRDRIVALTRDHELLRQLLKDAKDKLDGEGAGAEALRRFQALILVDELHNKEEMDVLPDH